MSYSELVIENYGEAMSIGGVSAKGFLCPLSLKNPEHESKPLPNGIKGKANYRLISNLSGIEIGQSVIRGGREYTVLRVEPVNIFGKLSHYECLLKLKGGAGDA